MPKSQMTTGLRPKHVPKRLCVACRCTDVKRGLVRLVRIENERVEIDTTGKQRGRGAYLCLNPVCWETALKRRSIEHALRITALHPQDQATLRQFGSDLLVEQPAPTHDENNRL